MNYFLKIILFFFFTTTIAFESEIADEIVFVVRTDYIKGHKTYKPAKALNAYENEYTYNVIMTCLNQSLTQVQKDFKIEIISHIIVGQLINDKLYEFLKESLSELGYKFEDIENLYMQNDVKVDRDLLENFDKDDREVLEKFINKVISKVALRQFDILILTAKAAIVDYIPLFKILAPKMLIPYPVTINERTFLFLNDYLRLCYLYGIFLLSSDLPFDEQLDFIKKMQEKIISFNKVLHEHKLFYITDNLSKFVNLKYLQLMSKKLLEGKVSKNIRLLNSFTSELNSLYNRFQTL